MREGIIDLVLTVRVKNKIIATTVITIVRDEFVKAINAEGALFYQGYARPLYLQPIYQKRIFYKEGYPFTSPLNSKCYMNYQRGICPIAEELYYSQMLINEHVRLPQDMEDIIMLLKILKKVS